MKSECLPTCRPSLGVVAICHNEERDLPGFLENVSPWVDEIVLVDDGSNDRTPEIARAPKVSFHVHPRNPGEYYADQRNKGISLASSDWLLHMDIDERVLPELADEIRSAIQDESKDGYRFRRTNYFLQRPMRAGGWQDWNLVHLARRARLTFGGMFHESCLLDTPESRIGQLRQPMLHLNDESFEERMAKSATYQEELVQRIEETHGRVGWWSFPWFFFRELVYKLIWKRGFLDGVPGLILAFHSATARFRALAVVWDRRNPVSRELLEAQIQERWKRP